VVCWSGNFTDKILINIRHLFLSGMGHRVGDHVAEHDAPAMSEHGTVFIFLPLYFSACCLVIHSFISVFIPFAGTRAIFLKMVAHPRM